MISNYSRFNSYDFNDFAWIHFDFPLISRTADIPDSRLLGKTIDIEYSEKVTQKPEAVEKQKLDEPQDIIS